MPEVKDLVNALRHRLFFWEFPKTFESLIYMIRIPGATFKFSQKQGLMHI